MKLERVEIADFRIPFTHPYRAGGLDIRERRGLLVRLTSDEGIEGFGEVSPLPGLHRESLEEARLALGEVGRRVQGSTLHTFGVLADKMATKVDELEVDGGLSLPTVCFGLQIAALGLFASATHSTPADVLSPSPRPRVALGGLFSGEIPEARAALSEGRFAHFASLKVKVGRRRPDEDWALLETLLEGLPRQTRLRLDANRALTLEDACQRFGGLPLDRIEYLEEPLSDPTQLTTLHQRTGLPIALDESLQDPRLKQLRNAEGVSAWVLKPARFGDLARLHSLALEAAPDKIGIVLSSCLETGLGLSAQVQLAAALPNASAPAGLATEGWLASDLIEPPFDSSLGMIETAAWQGRPAPDVLATLHFERAV